MVKLGCCTAINGLTAVKKAGFDFVDLPGAELSRLSFYDVECLADRLWQMRLPCIGIHAAVPPDIRLCGRGSNEKKVMEYAQALCAKLNRLNIRFLGIGSPLSRSLFDEDSRDMAKAQLCSSIRIFAEELPNAFVLLESLNKKETNFINTMSEAYEMISLINLENTGLVCDLYHMAKSGETTAAFTAQISRSIRYLHIADPNRRRFPEESSPASLFKLLKDVEDRTGCGYLSIEAISSCMEKDAATGYRTMQKIFHKYGWR